MGTGWAGGAAAVQVDEGVAAEPDPGPLPFCRQTHLVPVQRAHGVRRHFLAIAPERAAPRADAD
eukprot:3772303-Rhodomonas_salina.1